MKTRMIITQDGSHTLYRTDLDETYHSRYGAIQEARHVYINNGLKLIKDPVIKIFEIGFGTGLNAILSIMEAEKTNQFLYYDSIEKYPLDNNLVSKLNYDNFLPEKFYNLFLTIHSREWNNPVRIENMILTKIKGSIQTHVLKKQYNLVYFDAFDPEKDSELWSKEIFTKIFQSMEEGGILTTFSVKGDIRRRLSDVGFNVEKVPGPQGKKHILRAIK